MSVSDPLDTLIFALYKGTKERKKSNFQKKLKKFCKKFGSYKKRDYFCPWRDGRVVDCGGLENR